MIGSKGDERTNVVATGRGFCATCSHGDSHKVSIERELRKAIHGVSAWTVRGISEKPSGAGSVKILDAIKIWATGGGI